VDRFYCSHCGDTFNEYGQQDEEDCCPHCAAPASSCVNQPEWAYQDEFDWLLGDFRSEVLRTFDSAHEDDTWLDLEDHALAANRFVWFGISEYCGVIALWMAPKDAPYDSPASWEALRDNWMAQAWPKFKKLANSCVPEPMVRLGTMSNGESVYQRVNPQGVMTT
jgi:hypothetical protein